MLHPDQFTPKIAAIFKLITELTEKGEQTSWGKILRQHNFPLSLWKLVGHLGICQK